MLLVFQGGGGGPLKLGITETCERIKEEFNFIQNQYHSWVLCFTVIVEFGLVVYIIPNGQIITIKMLWSDGCWVKSLKDQIVRTFKTSRIFPLNSFNFTLNLECGKYQLLKTFVTTIAFVSEGLWLYIILFWMLSFNSIWLMDVEVMFLNIRELEMFLNFKYFRLKLECEKLAQEKTEMQRHYVMVSFLINLFRSSSGFKLKRGKLNIWDLNPNVHLCVRYLWWGFTFPMEHDINTKC